MVYYPHRQWVEMADHSDRDFGERSAGRQGGQLQQEQRLEPVELKKRGSSVKRVQGAVVAPGSGVLRMTSAQVAWSSHWD